MSVKLDFVIQQVADYLGVVDSSELYIPVKLYIRDVIRDIGYDMMCDTHIGEFHSQNGKVVKTSDIIRVLDISKDGVNFNGVRVGSSVVQSVGNDIPFLDTFHDLTFIRPQEKSCRIFVKYNRLYVDENGDEIIPDEAFMSTLRYMQYSLLDGRPLHPDYRNRQMKRYEYDSEINKARSALLNNITPAANRFRRR